MSDSDEVALPLPLSPEDSESDGDSNDVSHILPPPSRDSDSGKSVDMDVEKIPTPSEMPPHISCPPSLDEIPYPMDIEDDDHEIPLPPDSSKYSPSQAAVAEEEEICSPSESSAVKNSLSDYSPNKKATAKVLDRAQAKKRLLAFSASKLASVSSTSSKKYSPLKAVTVVSKDLLSKDKNPPLAIASIKEEETKLKEILAMNTILNEKLKQVNAITTSLPKPPPVTAVVNPTVLSPKITETVMISSPVPVQESKLEEPQSQFIRKSSNASKNLRRKKTSSSRSRSKSRSPTGKRRDRRSRSRSRERERHRDRDYRRNRVNSRDREKDRRRGRSRSKERRRDRSRSKDKKPRRDRSKSRDRRREKSVSKEKVVEKTRSKDSMLVKPEARKVSPSPVREKERHKDRDQRKDKHRSRSDSVSKKDHTESKSNGKSHELDSLMSIDLKGFSSKRSSSRSVSPPTVKPSLYSDEEVLDKDTKSFKKKHKDKRDHSPEAVKSSKGRKSRSSSPRVKSKEKNKDKDLEREKEIEKAEKIKRERKLALEKLELERKEMERKEAAELKDKEKREKERKEAEKKHRELGEKKRLEPTEEGTSHVRKLRMPKDWTDFLRHQYNFPDIRFLWAKLAG